MTLEKAYCVQLSISVPYNVFLEPTYIYASENQQPEALCNLDPYNTLFQTFRTCAYKMETMLKIQDSISGYKPYFHYFLLLYFK